MRKITANKGGLFSAWHDLIKGLDQIDEEKSEGLEESRRIVEKYINQEIKQTKIPSNKIIVMGFSQGGALAMHVAYQSKIPLGGAIALSGYLPFYNEFSKLITNESKETPLLICHGQSDEFVKVCKAQRAHDVLNGLGVKQIKLEAFPTLGHNTSPAEMKIVEQFIEDQLAKSTTME